MSYPSYSEYLLAYSRDTSKPEATRTQAYDLHLQHKRAEERQAAAVRAARESRQPLGA